MIDLIDFLYPDDTFTLLGFIMSLTRHLASSNNILFLACNYSQKK